MTVLRLLITIFGLEIESVKMMNKKILLLALVGSFTGLKAHDFADTTGGTVVASFDISGSELWHNFFAPSHIYLVKQLSDRQENFKYINHPPYIKQELPEHRMVCETQRGGGNNQQDRCNDEFPHVHFDDFRMALKFANDMCSSYGAGIVPDFVEPTTFVNVGVDKTPASSHHYFYRLFQGLKFDCVLPATR